MKRLIMIALMACVLIACVQPTTVQTTTNSTVLPVAEVARDPAVIATPSLPGRLLLAKAGNLVMWSNGNLQQLTISGDAWQPAFSRDGTRIVFVRRGQSFSDIMLTSSAGGEAIQLTDNGSRHPLQSFERMYDSMWAFYPTFTPDGSRIAYASQFGPPEGSPAAEYRLIMYVMDARARAQRSNAYADGSGNIGRMIFENDGDHVIFEFNPAVDSDPRILRYSISQRSLSVPTGVPNHSYDPALSPDNARLYFAKRDDQSTDIYMLNFGSSSAQKITNLGTARSPEISPDGEWMVFLAIPEGASGFELWAQKLKDGLPDGNPMQMTRDQLFDADSGISWGQ
jgi:TolB protein